MRLDSDVAVVGTGLAALIAALTIRSLGKKVLILNPDSDFFLENSELPLDPLLCSSFEETFDFNRISRGLPDAVLNELRPYFPGAVEYWTESSQQGTQVLDAPFIRGRGRLWISSKSNEKYWPWTKLEEKYILASDSGLKPQVYEGYHSVKRFPGSSRPSEDYSGLFIPRLCDVDIIRYRQGVLEYIREKSEEHPVVFSVTQLETVPTGIRFRYEGQTQTIRLSEGTLVFLTPRMLSWVLDEAKRKETKHFEMQSLIPQGLKLWEQWVLMSRESLDPSVVGMYQDMAVWAECEGLPNGKLNRLSVLKKGDQSWISKDSIESVRQMCIEFLGWDRFSVRSVQPRAVFDWTQKQLENNTLMISQSQPRVTVVTGSDGPVFDVVRTARKAALTFK